MTSQNIIERAQQQQQQRQVPEKYLTSGNKKIPEMAAKRQNIQARISQLNDLWFANEKRTRANKQ